MNMYSSSNKFIFIPSKQIECDKLYRRISIIIKVCDTHICRFIKSIASIKILDSFAFYLESNCPFSDNSHNRTWMQVKRCL